MCSYSLTQTELFLRSLLEEEPVKTVVAPEFPRSDHLRAASKEREKVFTISGNILTSMRFSRSAAAERSVSAMCLGVSDV